MKKYRLLIVVLLLLIAAASIYYGHYKYLHRYDVMIGRVAQHYRLDPALVRAIVYEESYFDDKARSSAGAVGLMQVTNVIVREWTRVTGKQDLSDSFPELLKDIQPKDNRKLSVNEMLLQPEVNLHLGCWYLEQLMKRYAALNNPLPVVLASYNAGPTPAMRWQQNNKNQPGDAYVNAIDYPETKRYVRSTLERYQRYKAGQTETDLGWWVALER